MTGFTRIRHASRFAIQFVDYTSTCLRRGVAAEDCGSALLLAAVWPSLRCSPCLQINQMWSTTHSLTNANTHMSKTAQGLYIPNTKSFRHKNIFIPATEMRIHKKSAFKAFVGWMRSILLLECFNSWRQQAAADSRLIRCVSMHSMMHMQNQLKVTHKTSEKVSWKH